MKKIALLFASLVCAQAAGATCLLGTCGPATKYEVNVLSVALCASSACSSPVTVGSSSRSFDIASASVGSAIGSYANFDSVTEGTYTHIQVVVSRTFTLSGTAGACSVSSSQLSVPNADATLDSAMVPLGITWNDSPTKSQLKIITALSSPLTVSRTSPMPSIAVQFGTSEGLMCVTTGLGSAPYPSPPDVRIVVQ